MKEQEFSGVTTWTVLTDRLGAVEIATAEACSVGKFVHSNPISNEVSGLTSFEVLEATVGSYAAFCSVIDKEY